LISQSNTIEDVQFELGELTLHGLAYGKKTDDIVLCLHGWLDNAASFSPLLAKFKEKRVIAIDWIGHGLSSHRSKDAHYHFIDYVYDLLLLFENNHWQKIDIVAHSMGGMIATAFAAAFPEKVNSLSLIDSIGFISGEGSQSTEQLRQGMLSRLKSKNQAKDKPKKYHQTEESAIAARMAVSDLKFKDAELIVKRALNEKSKGFEWRADQRLRNISPYRLTLGQAEQFVKDIKAPVQVIYGDCGMEMVTKGIKHFAAMFSRFQSHELSGGHHVHMEQAQQVAELILTFIYVQSHDN